MSLPLEDWYADALAERGRLSRGVGHAPEAVTADRLVKVIGWAQRETKRADLAQMRIREALRVHVGDVLTIDDAPATGHLCTEGCYTFADADDSVAIWHEVPGCRHCCVQSGEPTPWPCETARALGGGGTR